MYPHLHDLLFSPAPIYGTNLVQTGYDSRHVIVLDNGGVSEMSAKEKGNACWGTLLGEDQCSVGFTPHANHMATKFCHTCCKTGIRVNASRVRALRPGQYSALSNGHGKSPWSAGGWRIVNHTKRCIGPRLIIFQDQPPDSILWAPIPSNWLSVDDATGLDFLRLSMKNGTLCPNIPRSGTYVKADAMNAWVRENLRDKPESLPGKSIAPPPAFREPGRPAKRARQGETSVPYRSSDSGWVGSRAGFGMFGEQGLPGQTAMPGQAMMPGPGRMLRPAAMAGTMAMSGQAVMSGPGTVIPGQAAMLGPGSLPMPVAMPAQALMPGPVAMPGQTVMPGQTAMPGPGNVIPGQAAMLGPGMMPGPGASQAPSPAQGRNMLLGMPLPIGGTSHGAVRMPTTSASAVPLMPPAVPIAPSYSNHCAPGANTNATLLARPTLGYMPTIFPDGPYQYRTTAPLSYEL